MATIAENLQKILNIKSDIKDAIIEKGVEISDNDTFETYPEKIRTISGGSGGGSNDNCMDYVWIPEGEAMCQGDDLGVKYVPQFTYNGEQYVFNGGISKVEVTEKNNSDCVNAQLLAETSDGLPYKFYPNGVNDNTQTIEVGSNIPYIIHDYDSWTSLQNFFGNNSNLTTVKRIPKFINTNITSFHNIFSDSGIRNTDDIIPLKGMLTSSCTNMYGAFANTSNLQELDLSKLEWDTSGVINMQYMFRQSAVQKLNLDNLDISKVTSGYLQYMFSGVTKLSDLSCNNWNLGTTYGNNQYSWGSAAADPFFGIHSTIERMSFKNWRYELPGSSYNNAMPWYSCSKLKYINIDGSYFLQQSSSYDVQYIVYNISSVEEISARDLEIEHSSVNKTFKNAFSNDTNLKKLDLSNITFNNITKVDSLVYGCSNLEELHLNGWDLTGITFEYTNFPYSKVASFKTVYMCGCNDETVQKVRTALDRYNPHVEIVSKIPTGDWRWSDDVDTLCKDGNLLTVHYKELAYGCQGEISEWIKDMKGEYQVISTQEGAAECDYQIEAETNGEWEPIDTLPVVAPNGNTKGYVNETITNTSNPRKRMRLWFTNQPDFNVYIMGTNWPSLYPLYISNLDTELPIETTDNSAGIFLKTNNANEWVTANYPNDGGKHFVDIVYRGWSGDGYKSYATWDNLDQTIEI